MLINYWTLLLIIGKVCHSYELLFNAYFLELSSVGVSVLRELQVSESSSMSLSAVLKVKIQSNHCEFHE